MSLPYNKSLISRAKSLRKDMTPQEKHLWYDFLKGFPVRFQRQKVIDSYIADFYCHKARLIVEIDGSQHSTMFGKAYDDIRTECLNNYGLEVVRFTNAEIDNSFLYVCETISYKVQQKLTKTDADLSEYV